MTYIPYKIVKNMDGNKIDLLNITTRNAEHQHCKLVIKDSKNSVHRGLYCCSHKKWLQWITSEQESILVEMGIAAQDKHLKDLSWE